MSFDAFNIPVAPQPAANSANPLPGSDSATLKSDRSPQPADQKESFLATLDRVSERRSCYQDRSGAAGNQATQAARSRKESDNSAGTGNTVDQDLSHDWSPEPEMTGSVAETPPVWGRPVMDLFNTLFAEDGTLPDQGLTQSENSSISAILNALLGHFQTDEPSKIPGLLGIGPFERLQGDISPEASNLAFIRQLLNRAIVQQFATEPAGSQADNPLLVFWRSLTATSIEGAMPDGGTETDIARANEFIKSLLQRYDNPTAFKGLQWATVEAGGQKTGVNMEALSLNQNLLSPKMTAAVQSAEAQPSETNPPPNAQNDAHLSVGGALKDIEVEALLASSRNQNAEKSNGSKTLPVTGSAEPLVNSNTVAGSIAVKPSEDAVNIKISGLSNDIAAGDQTGGKVIQIDGEAKDNSFFSAQENLPEHLTRLEHSGRSAEGAPRNLAAQTMNQIVQKAVLLNNNGQNTVQIDLKPDFLGHIRMQIVTESHQVAVRIMAEIPFVKDMLESNLNQLKAELQSQGLDVSELEVSVAHDSRADDDLYHKAAAARRAKALKGNHPHVDAAAEKQSDGQAVHSQRLTDTAIDFFA